MLTLADYKQKSLTSLKRDIKLTLINYELLLMVIIPVAWYIIFLYLPIYGIQIAFKNYNPSVGIYESPWVGFRHFERFFASYVFDRVIRNTVLLSVYNLIICFPIPIFLAILLNEIKNKRLAKLLQNITYIPYFISVVVIIGMLFSFLSINTGMINNLIALLGGEKILFLQSAEWFRPLFIMTEAWQHSGFSAIIYIAALSSIDPTIYEAAFIDGASKFKRIIYITLPSLLPTIVIIFILNIGRLLNVSFEKVLLMQNQSNLEYSEVISTFVYRTGILMTEYSLATAVDLFNAGINLCLLLTANFISKRVGGNSLW